MTARARRRAIQSRIRRPRAPASFNAWSPGTGSGSTVSTKPPRGTSSSDRRARVDEMAERLAASGATLVTASTNEYDEYCVNMLDPEGNEFDVQ